MISEFIGPLSATYTTAVGEYQSFKVYYVYQHRRFMTR